MSVQDTDADIHSLVETEMHDAETEMHDAVLSENFQLVIDWVKSRGQGIGVNVIFYNDLSTDVRLDWIDWNGDAITYVVLRPDNDGTHLSEDDAEQSFYEVDTWSEHPWRVVENSTNREVARVRFKQSCAVHISELVAAADLDNRFPLAWCCGLQLTLDLLSEKQLAFAMALHERLGEFSIANSIDEHVMQLILDSRHVVAHPTYAPTTKTLIDVDVGRTGASSMKELKRGVGMACDDKGNIFLTDALGNRVVKIERSTGHLLWSVACACPLAVAFDDDMHLVFAVARGDNRVQVMSAENGGEMQRYDKAMRNLLLPSGVAVHGENVYVAETARDTVLVFRKSDGERVGGISMEGGPRGLAVKGGAHDRRPGVRGGRGSDERGVDTGDERGDGAPHGAVLVVTLTKKQAVAIVALSADLRERATTYILVKPPPSLRSTSLDLAAVDEFEDTLLVCDVAHGVVLVWRFDGEFVGYMRAGGRGGGVASEAIGEGEETCAVRGLTIDIRTGLAMLASAVCVTSSAVCVSAASGVW